MRDGNDYGIPLRDIYKTFDRNSDGMLTKTELAIMLGKLNLRFEDQALNNLIRRFDRNGDGVIDFEEFKTFLSSGQRY